MEDPNKHLKEFEVVCSSMTPVNVDGCILKMKAFPFSLMDKAKAWLYELAAGTVTSWESMKRAFLEKFFPTSRIILLRKKISGIQQEEGHASEKCPQLIENGGWESANAIGFQSQNQPRHDPYSNTYNPGWRDHPNFKWREPQQSQPQGGFRQQPPGFYTKPYAPPQVQPQSAPNASGTSLDNDALLKILTKLSQGQDDHTQAMQNQNKRVDHLEKQIGQIADFVGKFRDQGQLPSSTIPNPKGGFEKEEEGQPTAKVVPPLPQASNTPKLSNSSNKGNNVSNSVSTNVVPSNAPFPSRFVQTKKEEAEKDILETLRKVQVNIPLVGCNQASSEIRQVSKGAMHH
ncbi:uncharacterized protein [Malus domestica]|uniref:uncharacterized protein n=1 Tax=Malus domestica TaxID=3750 RepID=UPI0039753105